MTIGEYIRDLSDEGYIELAQDIEDATSDPDMDTTAATGGLRSLLANANRKVYCPLGF